MTEERRRVVEAVDRGDLDELVRLVDGLCGARDWDGVVMLRDRCRHALEERGLQLWPAAEFAEYRLATRRRLPTLARSSWRVPGGLPSVRCGRLPPLATRGPNSRRTSPKARRGRWWLMSG